MVLPLAFEDTGWLSVKVLENLSEVKQHSVLLVLGWVTACNGPSMGTRRTLYLGLLNRYLS